MAARDNSDDNPAGGASQTGAQTHSRDPRKNRRLLVQATLDSVAEDGITDTTVTTIIKRAGLSRGMIHLHFGGKDGLLVAAAEAFAEHYFEEMQRQLALAGDAPEAVIQAVVRADLSPEVMNERAVAIWHGFRGESRTNPDIARYSDTRDMRLRETIYQAFLTLLDGDAHAANEVTLGTLAMLEGMWTDYLTHPDRFSRDTAIRIIMRFLGGVVPGYFRIDQT